MFVCVGGWVCWCVILSQLQTAVCLSSHVYQREAVISKSPGWPCAAKANHSYMRLFVCVRVCVCACVFV